MGNSEGNARRAQIGKDLARQTDVWVILPSMPSGILFHIVGLEGLLASMMQQWYPVPRIGALNEILINPV